MSIKIITDMLSRGGPLSPTRVVLFEEALPASSPAKPPLVRPVIVPPPAAAPAKPAKPAVSGSDGSDGEQGAVVGVRRMPDRRGHHAHPVVPFQVRKGTRSKYAKQLGTVERRQQEQEALKALKARRMEERLRNRSPVNKLRVGDGGSVDAELATRGVVVTGTAAVRACCKRVCCLCCCGGAAAEALCRCPHRAQWGERVGTITVVGAYSCC